MNYCMFFDQKAFCTLDAIFKHLYLLESPAFFCFHIEENP